MLSLSCMLTAAAGMRMLRRFRGVGCLSGHLDDAELGQVLAMALLPVGQQESKGCRACMKAMPRLGAGSRSSERNKDGAATDTACGACTSKLSCWSLVKESS